MKLNSDLFADYLKCPTKCYLHAAGQAGTGNAYADWVREQNDAYRREAAQRLVATVQDGAAIPADVADLKSATWGSFCCFGLERENAPFAPSRIEPSI